MAGVTHEGWRPTAPPAASLATSHGEAPDTQSAHAAPAHPAPGPRLPRVLTVMVASFAILWAIMLALGFFLTNVVNSSVGRWDENINRDLVPDRAGTWNGITQFSTSAMNTLPAVAIVVVLVALFAWRRRWVEVGVVAIAMILEITVFLSTTFLVGRPRPAVPRLNSTPATSSFPSGHTAAATVLAVALALIVTWHTQNKGVRVAAWAVACLAIAAVGIGRVYRGMHHPTDVLAGVLLGVGCVVAAVVAVRAASAPARPSGP